ncbi:hypothetical protein AVDCRST_MAG94-99, partial [uncultured Leptolyngbya sp.]
FAQKGKWPEDLFGISNSSLSPLKTVMGRLAV